MPKHHPLLLILFLVTIGCSKEKEMELNLNGQIKGKVFLYDEFGKSNTEYQDVEIVALAGDSSNSAAIDESGNYQINELNTGTYKLVCTKPGYGTRIIQSLQLIGGDLPIYFSFGIGQKSSTTIHELQIEYINSNRLKAKAIINHNYIKSDYWSPDPRIKVFLSLDPEVSFKNYETSGELTTKAISGTQLEETFNIRLNSYPSGSKVYAIAYGASNNYYRNWNTTINNYIFHDLGQASNRISFIMP
jgi:hypothetical protein